jgi:hypothetical protein
VADDGRWRNDLPIDDVVGQIEQPGHEQSVASGGLLEQRLTPARGRRPLGHESALRTDRNDDGVLDHLRLHQAQDLHAEVLAPVRPPDPAARDPPAAEVHTLNARRVDEDLEPGTG